MDPQHGYEEGFRHDRSPLIDGGTAIQTTSRRLHILVIYAVYKSKGIRKWKFRISNPKGRQARRYLERYSIQLRIGYCI